MKLSQRNRYFFWLFKTGFICVTVPAVLKLALVDRYNFNSKYLNRWTGINYRQYVLNIMVPHLRIHKKIFIKIYDIIINTYSWLSYNLEEYLPGF